MACNRTELLQRLPVALLVVIFGIGAWVAINGLWVQLPLLVALGIPEGYNLASYLVIIIQLANIGPLIFTIANWWVRKGIKIETHAICVVLLVGIVSCLLLVFYWDKKTTWDIDSSLHSTALLCLAFFLAIVDCTSSVAFTPFMARFKNLYLTWYFVGEGFSALLPSLVALGQGVGSVECIANYTYTKIIEVNNKTYQQNCTDWIQQPKAANFPPEDFFWFLFCMMSSCAVAFLLLNILPVAKREHAMTNSSVDSLSTTTSGSSHDMLVRSDNSKNHGTIDQDDFETKDVSYSKQEVLHPTDGLSTPQYAYLYCLIAFVNALSNGILASIQSYSAGAYGLNTYLLAATLSNVANPLACFLVIASPSMSLTLVGIMTCLGSVAGVYCLAIAAMSPTPPLQFQMIGSVIIVLAWILTTGIFSYTKATIGWILRNQPNNRVLLIWFGGVTQIGSLIGALIMFPLVNYANLFVGYYENACADFAQCDGMVPASIPPSTVKQW